MIKVYYTNTVKILIDLVDQYRMTKVRHENHKTSKNAPL